MRNENMKIVPSKKVTITEYGARVLGEHALTLDPSDPARAQIALILNRFDKAPAIPVATLTAVAA